MNNRYLIKIETVTGKTLYIDGESQVMPEDYIIDNPFLDENIVFITDLQNAKAAAKLYGGEIVKCVMVMAFRSVSDE